MKFEFALAHLKSGDRVARSGWNGKNMHLFLVKEWHMGNSEKYVYQKLPFIAMKTAQDTLVPWLASQTDILAEDWMVVTK